MKRAALLLILLAPLAHGQLQGVYTGVLGFNAGTVATPTDLPGQGTYGSTQSVTLATVTGGATIGYTTDGSTPTASAGTITHGTTYTTAISVASTTTVKAIASKSGMTNSGVLTSLYTITGGALSWAALTNGQWTGLTNGQWTGMTN